MTDRSSNPRIPQAHRVLLVRHAQSQVDPEREASEWILSSEGQAAARRLTALAIFERVAAFYAGPEPKLLATLAPVAAVYGKAVQPESAFGETRSAGWLGEEAFLGAVRRLFAMPDQPPAEGWEPASAAATRLAAGVERLCARHEPVVHAGHALPGTFAIASGGRALVSYLAHLLSLDADHAFDVWRRLRMPDLAVVDLVPEREPRLVIPFGTLGV
jgi:broad specificity phosphatase PhoE